MRLAILLLAVSTALPCAGAGNDEAVHRRLDEVLADANVWDSFGEVLVATASGCRDRGLPPFAGAEPGEHERTREC